MKSTANIGNFDTPVTYRKPTRAKATGSLGQVKETWEDFINAWVQMTRLGGEETITRLQVDSAEFYEITGHFIPGVDTTYRIKVGSQEYHILRVDLLDRNKWMKLKVSIVID